MDIVWCSVELRIDKEKSNLLERYTGVKNLTTKIPMEQGTSTFPEQIIPPFPLSFSPMKRI